VLRIAATTCFAQVLEGGLSRAGVPYSYGFAIILLTIMVKVATFPLSKKSVSWDARVWLWA
jgi:YidC/Oxa1 family membrane protein insertase